MIKQNKMRIIIPTDDRLTIAPDFERAKSYMMMTIMNGRINEEYCISVNKDLRDKYPFGLEELKNENSSNPASLKGEDIFNMQIALTLSLSHEAEGNLRKLNYQVFHTEEKNIINALASFLRDQAVIESDYCCCP
jgi:predicted Fe-Mo cluster-binding NifX family protein